MKVPTPQLVDAIKAFPVIPLGNWPSPLQSIQHPDLGKVLIKRDDLSGFGRQGRSGVKARKLECMLAHLAAKGKDALYMPLGNVTNLAHDIVPVAKQAGIDLKILVADIPPLPFEVRQELFEDIQEQIEFCSASRFSTLNRLWALRKQGRKKGGNPAVVLPSPAHPSAIVGAAKGFIEMVEQCEQQQAFPRSVYIASAAAITASGFILGEAALRRAGYPKIHIVPVQVVPDPLKLVIPLLLLWAWKFMRFSGLPKLDGYKVAKRKAYTGYAEFDAQLADTCKRVFTDFGLEIDPIYGAKSWQTMEQMEAGKSQNERPTLFWHCGYTPDWQHFANFPYNQQT